jgi:hypothetical protein
LELPNWYLGSGGVTQTVWNKRHGFDPGHGIRDYDLVYFDAADLSREAEDDRSRATHRLLADLDIDVEVTNEARVHLWYEADFGVAIPPYRSTEDAISTWPTTATSIGVRYGSPEDPLSDELVVYAPFGLSDLFALVVRPNTALVTREVYQAKARRWAGLWPGLTVVPWALPAV